MLQCQPSGQLLSLLPPSLQSSPNQILSDASPKELSHLTPIATHLVTASTCSLCLQSHPFPPPCHQKPYPSTATQFFEELCLNSEHELLPFQDPDTARTCSLSHISQPYIPATWKHWPLPMPDISSLNLWEVEKMCFPSLSRELLCEVQFMNCPSVYSDWTVLELSNSTVII